MVSTRNLCKIVLLLGLVSCCRSVGASPLLVTTAAPAVVETVAAAAPPANVVNEPTVAPITPVHHSVHTSVAPETIPKELPATTGHHVLATTHAPAIVPSHPPALAKDVPAAAVDAAATTLAPHVVHAVSSEKPVVVTHTVHHTTVLPTAAAHVVPAGNVSNKEVCTGFCDYIKPICESLSKISAKQLFKIQSQFKQFVQKVSFWSQTSGSAIMSALLVVTRNNLPVNS